MSGQIKAGDLVVVVRACCVKSERWLGRTFAAIPVDSLATTICCGRDFAGPFFTDTKFKDIGGWSVAFLKRIPPLDELESEKRKEELTA